MQSTISLHSILPALPEMYLAAAICVVLLVDVFAGAAARRITPTLTLFVIALGVSACGGPVGMVATATWFERRRATALSLTAAGGAIGGIMVRVTVLSMDTFGWRETALLSAGLLLLIGLPLSFFVRWRPADHGLHVDGVAPDADAEVLGSGEIVAADGTRGFGCNRHAAAPARVLVVTETIDDENVAGPKQAQRMVEQRRVLARNCQRHGHTGDALGAQ